MPPKNGGQAQGQSNKRKGAPASSSDNNASRNKRVKTQRDARTLAVQTTSKAFKNGELDVGSFIKAREYEIKALEDGLARSKKALTQRAFQQVPKDLRRRTASHNAKRVPKRLRKQAEREMVDDNTPTVTARRRKLTRHMRLRMETVKRLRALGASRKQAANGKTADDTAQAEAVQNDQQAPPGAIKTRTAKVKKNMLSTAPVPPAKFRKRQVHKQWLPTHIYHAKRAHMTSPREPLWRFAIPLTSTAKSYRPTHRASNERGAIAWDTSYMSTVSIEGAEQSIQGVLKALNVGGKGDLTAPWGPKGQRWRNGTRVWQGWLYARDQYPTTPIAPATVIWRLEAAPDNSLPPLQTGKEEATARPAKKDRRQAIIRIHPSTFLQLWEQLTRLAKIQNSQVVIEDLRFELGSIEVVGPGSTEALLGALWPTVTADAQSEPSEETVEGTWKTLASVTNAAVLPPGALLSFDISDPRLHHPPRTVPGILEHDEQQLFRVLSEWKCESVLPSSGIFDRKRRQAASRALSSQKAINRRKSTAGPGTYPEPLPQDPRIPVLLYPSVEPSTGKRKQATWVVVLPWKTVLPVWQSIMYYPLSTGGQVRLGGLQEKRQVAFEHGIPWFPGDFPGTQAGEAWEALESARRRKEWERRPKGKRIEWSSLALGPGRTGEIGDGSACDWKYLTTLASQAAAAHVNPAPTTPATNNESDNAAIPQPPVHNANSNANNNDIPKLHHISAASALRMLTATATTTPPSTTALATIRLTLLTRGVAAPCARIYRLPADDTHSPSNPPTTTQSLRARWLSLDPSQQHPSRKPQPPSRSNNIPRNVPHSTIRQHLAADLLLPPASTSGMEAGPSHPEVPGEDDLIGFVTTGEFCLTEGKGVAVGSVLLGKLLEGRGGVVTGGKEEEDRKKKKKGGSVGRRRLVIVRNAGEVVGRLAEWDVV